MPGQNKSKVGKVAEPSKKSSTATSQRFSKNDMQQVPTNQVSALELQRAITNPKQADHQTILALQQSYGNRAVARLLSNKTAPNSQVSRKTIQRDFVLANGLDTNLTQKDKIPTRLGLKRTARALVKQVNDDILTPVNQKGSPVNKLITKYTPSQNIPSKLDIFWSFDGADGKARNGNQQEQKKQQIANRQQTLQYHLTEALWNEVADAAARRVKRASDKKVAQLTQQMAVDIAGAEQNNVAQGNDKQAMKDYKTVILQTYQNDIDKQKKLAQSITKNVALEVAKGVIDGDNRLVLQIIQTERNGYYDKMSKPLVSKYTGLHKAQVLDPLESIRRKEMRLTTIKQEIINSSDMSDKTRAKYRDKLAEEYSKLQTADYKTNLVDKADALKTDWDTKELADAKNAVDGIKTTTTELMLKRFNAGSKNVLYSDYTAIRHQLKEAVTKGTNTVIKNAASKKNKNKTIATKNVLGEDENKSASDVVKKAKEDSIKDVLEGSVHSKLRHLGKVIKVTIPQAGDKAKLELMLKVPVGDPHGGGYLGMRLTGQIEHDIEWDEEKEKKNKDDWFLPKKKDKNGNPIVKADTFKVRTELALIGGYRVPFVFDVGGEIGGYFEAESDQGSERAMELVSFGFYRRFRESKIIPHAITDQLWGFGGESAQKDENASRFQNFKSRYKAKTKEAKAWGGAFQESFSDKEYIENGSLGALTGSASITGVTSFKGGLKGTTGKRYTKQTMEALQRNKKDKQQELVDDGSTRERNIGRKITGAELSADFSVGPFTFSGKLKGSFLESQSGDNLDKNLHDEKDRLEKRIQFLQTTKSVTDFEQAETELAQVKSQIAEAQKNNQPVDPQLTLDKTRLEQLINGKTASEVLVQRLLTARADLKQVKKDIRLLKRQIFAVETELSAASKGGSFANPSQLAALIMQWSGELGAKVRTLIMSFKDQYGKDKKGKNIGSALFASAFGGVEAGVNHAKNFSQAAAEKSFQSSQDMVNTQMNSSLSTALHNQSAWDKMNQFALKSAAGMKITFKQSTKRDFASSDEGAKFSKNYPTKVEFILDQVAGGSMNVEVVGLSLERVTRLLRIGVKYKDGNASLMAF